ncbi:MAG TPA: beta-propeller domain-containing protein [Solirubrobacter sp.]|nr:beta-propeller domain-containing protein [Solirubrobacter sp.]
MRTLVATVSFLLALAGTADAAAPTYRLKSFSSCKALVGYARDGALRTRGDVGVPGRVAAPPTVAIATPPLLAVPAPETAAAPTSDTAVSGVVPDFSSTNTQELDVDEPDLIKTDGRRIVAVTDATLRVLDAGGTVEGTLPLEGYDHRLLLRGDRVLAIASKRPSGPTAAPLAPAGPAMTVVTEIDVSGAPKVLRTLEVPGRFVDARQNGATARLVIDTPPQPIAAAGGESLKRAVARAGRARFLARTTLKSRISGRTFKRDLAPCTAITHPRRFSGLDVLAILTIDLDRGMYSLDRDGVMAGAQVVYGSDRSLYVASQRYVRALETQGRVPDEWRTEIHRFDIADPARTVYAATGTVPGFIIGNYALSEYKGDLRVASTTQPPWNGLPAPSESRVTVLRQDGARLKEIGAVGGIGQRERIYAVRFMGERGYVVTFAPPLGDPLFTLDLSDPTAPKVVGELQIPGYSAYLHPVGDGLLLGVGRENANVKAALYDVSNPAAPREIGQLQYPDSRSAVETEPHAFLFWPRTQLAVLPLRSWSPAQPFDGAVGLRVSAGGLAEAGRITHHGERDAAVQRSLVIGDTLYSLSWLGLARNATDTLAPIGYTAFSTGG